MKQLNNMETINNFLKQICATAKRIVGPPYPRKKKNTFIFLSHHTPIYAFGLPKIILQID